MALYGYARVSTLDQNLGIQRAALKAAGCDVIRAEKATGTRRDGRTELQVLLDFLRPGDVLVVMRIDRLARSLKDLQDIVHELKGRRVALRATEQPIDTGTAAGKAFLEMLGVFAEFETNLRKERQAEGIAAAKAAVSTRGGSRKSISRSSTSFGTRRSSGRPILHDGSALSGPAFIACLGRRRRRSHAHPRRVATALSPALARAEQPRPLRARWRKVPTLWPTTPRPPPLPAGRALVRRASDNVARSPGTAGPMARPCGGNSVSDDPRRLVSVPFFRLMARTYSQVAMSGKTRGPCRQGGLLRP
jgi:DNA invertase Pin-like site-specific DNA recombinase